VFIPIHHDISSFLQSFLYFFSDPHSPHPDAEIEAERQLGWGGTATRLGKWGNSVGAAVGAIGCDRNARGAHQECIAAWCDERRR
jgi:hypothetical protein